jgi:hypothetical protein
MSKRRSAVFGSRFVPSAHTDNIISIQTEKLEGTVLISFKNSILALAMSTLLAACGGGSDGSSSDAADKYVGTWDLPCLAEGGASANGFVTLAKTGPNSLSGTSTANGYAGSSCSGAAIVSQQYPAALTIDGSVTASGKSADKITDTSFGETDKDLAYVEGNRLYFGAEGAAKDTQGYPTELDLSQAVIRR